MFPGFQTWLRENIRLEVGQDLVIDVVLLPGAQDDWRHIDENVSNYARTGPVLVGHLRCVPGWKATATPRARPGRPKI